jgi:hypothetical protein
MPQPFHNIDGSLGRIVYRETILGPRELDLIRSTIEDRVGGTLTGTAERLCRDFGWFRPNGQPATSSCAVFLGRLAKAGVISLPVNRKNRSDRHQDKDRAAMVRALGPVEGCADCQPEGPLLVRPIAPEEWDGFWVHMDRYHYLGFTKPAGESICYAALVGAELVALLVWGAAVFRNRPRDALIGWSDGQRARRLNWIVNNSRFLILPWIRTKCLASRVLSANLRRLSADWEERYKHPIFLAETFIDSSRFRGTCYRASNWRHVGRTQGFSRSRHAASGFIQHGCPKEVFVYPLRRNSLEFLAGLEPLPGENAMPARTEPQPDLTPEILPSPTVTRVQPPPVERGGPELAAGNLERASSLRQALVRLRDEEARLLDLVMRREAIVRGTVYVLRRKCGKPRCACTTGALHPSTVLSWTQDGRKRLRTLRPAEQLEMTRQTGRYRLLRSARARLSALHVQMLEIADKLETLRCVEPQSPAAAGSLAVRRPR